MSNGTDIRAEVAAALAEAGTAVGNGPMICTLRRVAAETGSPQANPYTDNPTVPVTMDYEVIAVQSMVRVRDASGTFIGQTMRKMTIEAGVIEPLKSDTIAIDVKPGDVTAATVFHDITDIEPLAPAGVALNYGIMIAD